MIKLLKKTFTFGFLIGVSVICQPCNAVDTTYANSNKFLNNNNIVILKSSQNKQYPSLDSAVVFGSHTQETQAYKDNVKALTEIIKMHNKNQSLQDLQKGIKQND